MTAVAETIYALSSGAPPAAIAIIRISGPIARNVAMALGAGALVPRMAALRRLSHPESGDLLDHALVLFFAGPNSATGEDLLELHVHGGRATVRAVERGIESVAGVRRAVAGEFTRRALVNGRIDIMQAEALGDLLSAETEAQRRQAICGAPYLHALVAQLRQRMLSISAEVEAAIDYDEEVATLENVTSSALDLLIGELRLLLDRPSAERLREGFLVVIAGPPNAGKSSLLNALAGRDVAIASAIAGTTRDIVEVPIAVADLPVRLCDTAGLRDGVTDEIEAIGIDRARRLCEAADLILWLGDAPPSFTRPAIHVAAKRDLGRSMDGLPVSSLTGAGLAVLSDAIAAALRGRPMASGEALLLNRHRDSLAVGLQALEAARCEDRLELRAEHLRMALKQLDQLGSGDSLEAMLDVLFARFCVGK